MRVRIIQLSDIHANDNTSEKVFNVDRVLSAISSMEDVDKYIIALSGDLAFSGQKAEYDRVNKFVDSLISDSRLIRNNSEIECLCVPGNHDIDFIKYSLPQDEDSFKKKYGKSIRSSIVDMDLVSSDYINAMSAFYCFSKDIKCEWKDKKDIIKKVIDCDGFRIGFVLVNSVFFSLLGGENVDKGCHRLTKNQLSAINSAIDSDISCLIMHHGIEWFDDDTKKQLRSIFAEKYTVVLVGHEHDEVAENRIINNGEPCFYMQANAYNDSSVETNGFSVIDIDTVRKELSAFSFCLTEGIYLSSKVGNAPIKKYSVGGVRNTDDYEEFLLKDHNGVHYDDYYYFPPIEYTYFENESPKFYEFTTDSGLIDFLIDNEKVSITGDRKSGKTILCKKIYRQLLERGIVPLLLDKDIHNMRKDHIIEYTFRNQYRTEHNAYERFMQLPKEKRAAIIDDADLIKPESLSYMIDILEKKFKTIILTYRTEVPTDMHRQVLEAIDYKFKLKINQYWYVARKGLIANVLASKKIPKENLESEVNKINDFINHQIKYFNLNPEFIIDFVECYERDYKFKYVAGHIAFSMVYENSIKNRIIVNCKNGSPEKIFNILQEIAYYMHFAKKGMISTPDLIKCIDKYREEYRQNVNYQNFIMAATESGILIEKNNEYIFADRIHLAYFVARAINQKASDPSEPEYSEAVKNFNSILDNICFSINSDIVLFLSVITNSTRFINLIIDKAEEFFDEKEELSFPKNNIGFISNTKLQIQDKLPGKEEKRKREKSLSESEKSIRVSDIIEVVNEYDYSDEDSKKYVNQLQKAYRFVEVLSKTLPAFCTNMKVNQQDRLVNLIYKTPNKFLYMILKEINDNFEEFVDMLHEEISELHKEQVISKDSVRKYCEQISVLLVMAIYKSVSDVTASNESLRALNEFPEMKASTNYEILNLMFNARVCNINSLSKAAIPLDKKLKKPIEKAIVKFAIRDYFLRNDVELHGSGASVIDYFFGNKNRKSIQIEMGKRSVRLHNQELKNHPKKEQ